MRQTAAEREDKVTQKLAIVLMGKESTKNIEEIEQKSEPFQCAKEEVDSANLNNLLSKVKVFFLYILSSFFKLYFDLHFFAVSFYLD